MMKTIVFIFFLYTAFICKAQEKNDYSEPLTVINAWIDAQIDYQNIPGISAGIVVDKKLVWSKGFGYSDLELKNKTTDSTIYSICSISKLFTSIAIMQLRDQGKLNLDDDIKKYLPWFNLKQTFPNSAPITIRSLLTHSGGVPRDSDFPYWADTTYPFPTKEQFREKLSSQKTIFPASEVYQYSNLGMTLLGEVVEEISGISYEEYVSQNILNPIGLNNTLPEMPEKYKKGKLATGYSVISRDGKRDELNFFQAKAIAPAAGFSSTVIDLAEFAKWQFDILENVDDPVLNGNTLKEMQRVNWLSPDWDVARGLGFGVYKSNNVTMVGHYGSCPGYLSQFKLVPNKKWAFIAMINSQGIDSYTFIEGMYNILDKYENTKSEEISDKVVLDNYAGIYYDIWDGESLIVPWKGNLAIFSLNTSSQNGPYTIAKYIEGDKFKEIRADGNIGTDIWFDRDKEGKVTKYWIHSFYMVKIKR